MFFPDKKKTVTVILSKMKPGGEETRQEIKPEESISDTDQILQSIAEDILQAVSDKSAISLKDALKAFLDQIQLLDHEQDEEQE